MGRVLALLLVVLVVGSVYLFVKEQWFPPTISEHGPAIDAQFERTLYVVGVAFILAQLALAYVVFRFVRRGDERAVYTHGSNKIEATWTILTAIVFITLAVLGQQVWASVMLNAAPADAVKIRVMAQQFNWNAHYAGPDGEYGRTAPKFIDDSSLNFVGIDPSDPNGIDDAQVTTVAVPVDRPVEITLRSKDVIHSFFVPAMRYKQDTVPGMDIRIHFKAKKVGKYELTCAELCGNLHYQMKSFFLVLPQSDYDDLISKPGEDFKVRLAELRDQYPVSD